MDMTPESQEVSPTVDHVGPQVLQSQHDPVPSEERRQNESGRTSLSIRSLFNYQNLKIVESIFAIFVIFRNFP